MHDNYAAKYSREKGDVADVLDGRGCCYTIINIKSKINTEIYYNHID